MKIILSQSYGLWKEYHFIENEEETLDKFLIKLGIILIVAYQIDDSFRFEENDIIEIFSKKFGFNCKGKFESYEELGEYNEIIECGYFNLNKLCNNYNSNNVYHVEINSFVYGYLLLIVNNNKELEKIRKNIKENKKKYKEVYEKVMLIMKNKYKKEYAEKIKTLKMYQVKI